MNTIANEVRGQHLVPDVDEIRRTIRDAGFGYGEAFRRAGVCQRRGREYTSPTKPRPMPLGAWVAILCAIGEHARARNVAFEWAVRVGHAIDQSEAGVSTHREPS